MNLNKLTEKAQEAIVAAQRLAEERHNTQLEPIHLLSALITQQGGVVPSVLEKLGVSPRTLIPQVDAAMAKLPRSATPSQLYVSAEFKRVFDQAQAEADRLKGDFVSTEHFLLALVDDQDKRPAGQILRTAGVNRDRAYGALQDIRRGRRG